MVLAVADITQLLAVMVVKVAWVLVVEAVDAASLGVLVAMVVPVLS